MEFSVARVLTAGHPKAPLSCEVLQAFSQVGAIIAAHGKGPSCSGNASIILIARAKESRQAQRDLVAVESKISRIVRAIEDGTASPTLTARLGELESERQRLMASMKEEIPSNVLALHPSIADRYRQKVSDIQTALRQNDETGREAVALVRELISAILVKPTSSGSNGLEIEGNFAALLFGGRSDGMTTEVSASRYQRCPRLSMSVLRTSKVKIVRPKGRDALLLP